MGKKLGKAIKQKINNVKIALTLGMSSADKQLMGTDVNKVPELAQQISQNFSSYGFLRSVQMGKMTEEQIRMHYKLLDKMDKLDARSEGDFEWDYVYENIKIKDEQGNWIDNPRAGEIKLDENGKKMIHLDEYGMPMKKWVPKKGYKTIYRALYDEHGSPINEKDENGKEIIDPVTKLPKPKYGWVEVPDAFISEEEQNEIKQKLGDQLEGYETILWLYNKPIDNSTLSTIYDLEPSLRVHREWFTYGVPKLENYCRETFIKIKNEQDSEKDLTCVVEFYCSNYDWVKMMKGNDTGEYEDMPAEDCYNYLINENGLSQFTDIVGFDHYYRTATRNDIPRKVFKISNFREIKKLEIGFVLRFDGEMIPEKENSIV